MNLNGGRVQGALDGRKADSEADHGLACETESITVEASTVMDLDLPGSNSLNYHFDKDHPAETSVSGNTLERATADHWWSGRQYRLDAHELV